MIKTRKLKLVSSSLKKYDHKINDYVLIEDPNQFENLGKTYKVSYVTNDGGVTNRLHSTDDSAIQEVVKGSKNKEYYINGIKYDKDTWKDMLNVSKMDPLLQTDKVFGN
jgi:hypothetical protein